jgi:hypothetical protein
MPTTAHHLAALVSAALCASGSALTLHAARPCTPTSHFAPRCPAVLAQAEPADESAPPTAEADAAEPAAAVCAVCGAETMYPGCENGRVGGGLWNTPAFKSLEKAVGFEFPIKAYRPCPEIGKRGKKYSRSGQTLCVPHAASPPCCLHAARVPVTLAHRERAQRRGGV